MSLYRTTCRGTCVRCTGTGERRGTSVRCAGTGVCQGIVVRCTGTGGGQESVVRCTGTGGGSVVRCTGRADVGGPSYGRADVQETSCGIQGRKSTLAHLFGTPWHYLEPVGQNSALEHLFYPYARPQIGPSVFAFCFGMHEMHLLAYVMTEKAA